MMDDFLHNLRTGKNKSFDRNRKQYDNNGYKNPDRQNQNDNRRKEAFQRSPPLDPIPAIKKLLGDIADGQRRQAEIDDRRAVAEERIASAMERIALGFSGNMVAAPVAEVERQTGRKARIAQDTVKPDHASGDEPTDVSGNIKSDSMTNAVQSVMDRKSILDLIGVMRKEDFSYEKIARTLEERGIPTFSGKGAWHSQTVSKLCHQFQPSQSQGI